MGSKIARCLNCSVPKGSSWIYCKYLDDVMAEKFDETGETQACIKYQHDAFDYNEIRIERERQDKKWGHQLHEPAIWLAILSEEVGEMASAILCMEFTGETKKKQRKKDYRNELIQIAAVAIAAIESLDYNKSHY